MAKSVGYVDWPALGHGNGEGQSEPPVEWAPYRKEGSVLERGVGEIYVRNAPDP